MRKKVIAGNWKMNKTNPEAKKLVADLKKKLPGTLKTKVIFIPPALSVSQVVEDVKENSWGVGVQNIFWELSGAYTGEISGDMVKGVGAEYVLVGHSERRAIFHEHDVAVNRKLRIALKSELQPILCVGETLEEREKKLTKEVVGNHIEIAFRKIGLEHAKKIIIAYEPVWAIGTGKTATPAQAQEVHLFIRDLMSTLYGKNMADAISILYGGSVKPENADELLKQNDIDGALVGGACLKVDSFAGIINSAEKLA
ncbi:MAG: triose-phosphate isomerase [Calditrichia bacterium]|nr:triose-phosphate isomerase [Calditrichia bacterium]